MVPVEEEGERAEDEEGDELLVDDDDDGADADGGVEDGLEDDQEHGEGKLPQGHHHVGRGGLHRGSKVTHGHGCCYFSLG